MTTYSRQAIVNLALSVEGVKQYSAKHKQMVDEYNAHKPLARGYAASYDDAWCSLWASWLSIKLGYTAIIPTEVGCERHIWLFKDLDSWVEKDGYVPKPGDFILYDDEDNGVGDNTGWASHIGLVIACDGSTITTMEGNWSHKVSRRHIKVNSRYIRGFATPKYTEDDVEPVKHIIDVDGEWGPDTTRKAQEVFGTEIDGIVSNQYKAYAKANPGLLDSTFDWQEDPQGYSPLIKAIQKKFGATQDGHIGPDTITAMQRYLDTPVDGHCDNPSEVVKAFQTWLNAQ